MIVGVCADKNGDKMYGKVVPNNRRLLVYILIDCFAAMAGEPIEAVRTGLKALLSDLKGDPQALENAWLSVITFGDIAEQVVPLTKVGVFQEPGIRAAGASSLGAAIKLLIASIEKDVRKTTSSKKGDYKPLVFIMTNGAPTDDWEGPADDLKKKRPGCTIIGCAASPGADDAVLKRIAENVVRLGDTSPGTLNQVTHWGPPDGLISTVPRKGDAVVVLPLLPKSRGIKIVD